MRKSKKEIFETVKKLAKRTAIHYANVACPGITYQPKVGKEVKQLRKF